MAVDPSLLIPDGAPGALFRQIYNRGIVVIAESSGEAAGYVTQAREARDQAMTAAGTAGTAATAAVAARDAAGESETQAEQHAGAAATSASNAATSAGAATSAAATTTADRAATDADRRSTEAARDTTVTARGEAITASGDAGQAADRAEDAQDAAEQVLALVREHGNGWTPVLATASDGERRVHHIAGWYGGTGPEPATGYLADSGIVQDISLATNIRGPADTEGGTVSSVNNVSPDGGGDVSLGIGDIPGLQAALAAAGQVKTVAGVAPDGAGNVPLTAAAVGADAAGAAAAVSEQIADLGESLSAVAYTGHADDLLGVGGTGAALIAAETPAAALAEIGALPATGGTVYGDLHVTGNLSGDGSNLTNLPQTGPPTGSGVKFQGVAPQGYVRAGRRYARVDYPALSSLFPSDFPGTTTATAAVSAVGAGGNAVYVGFSFGEGMFAAFRNGATAQNQGYLVINGEPSVGFPHASSDSSAQYFTAAVKLGDALYVPSTRYLDRVRWPSGTAYPGGYANAAIPVDVSVAASCSAAAAPELSTVLLSHATTSSRLFEIDVSGEMGPDSVTERPRPGGATNIVALGFSRGNWWALTNTGIYRSGDLSAPDGGWVLVLNDGSTAPGQIVQLLGQVFIKRASTAVPWYRVNSDLSVAVVATLDVGNSRTIIEVSGELMSVSTGASSTVATAQISRNMGLTWVSAGPLLLPFSGGDVQALADGRLVYAYRFPTAFAGAAFARWTPGAGEANSFYLLDETVPDPVWPMYIKT